MSEQVLSLEKQPAEKPFPWRCPKCRQLTVTRVTMPYRCQRRLGNRVVTVEVPNLAVPRCSNCGEVVFDYSADEQIRAAFRTQFGPAESVTGSNGMEAPEHSLCIRIAGNTENPCLLALRAKGYKLTLSFTKDREGNYRQDIDAELNGRSFSATTAAELLGLVAMWEVRGDDWRRKEGEPIVRDELYPSSITYDLEGNIIEIGDKEVK